MAAARAFKPLDDAERRRISESILAERKVAMARFLDNHADAWGVIRVAVAWLTARERAVGP